MVHNIRTRLRLICIGAVCRTPLRSFLAPVTLMITTIHGCGRVPRAPTQRELWVRPERWDRVPVGHSYRGRWAQPASAGGKGTACNKEPCRKNKSQGDRLVFCTSDAAVKRADFRVINLVLCLVPPTDEGCLTLQSLKQRKSDRISTQGSRLPTMV